MSRMSLHRQAEASVIRPKPPLPPKPKLRPKPRKGAEQKENRASKQMPPENGSAQNDLKQGKPAEKAETNEAPNNEYPCICEQLNIEVTVPTPSECRKYFLRKSFEQTNFLIGYVDNGRDSGNSSVASSSSSSLSYAPFSSPRLSTATTSQQVQHSEEQQPHMTAAHGNPKIPRQNSFVEGNNVRKPLEGESRVSALERSRTETPGEEQGHEALDLGARASQPSEDEGVCCESKITKKAKELVRPQQEDGQPRLRLPTPAKPPRPSLQKSSRPNSTDTIPSVQFAEEDISDRESNYKENLDLVDQIQAAAQTAGYRASDTSRNVVPPVPGVPVKGRWTKRDSPACRSAASVEMEQETEFKSVLTSQTSIELKGVTKKNCNSPREAPKLQIDLEATKGKPEPFENAASEDDSPVAEAVKPPEKKSLLKRVKSIKMENPFRSAGTDEGAGEAAHKPQSGLMKIFSQEAKEHSDEPRDCEKPSLSSKFSKVFHREKKEQPDAPIEEKRKISHRFGRVFKSEPRDVKQDESAVDTDPKKPSLMSKIFSKDTKEGKELKDSEIDEGEKKSFMAKVFLRDPKDATDDPEENAERKSSLISRMFSRDARGDELPQEQDKKTFSEKFSDFKGKVFSRKDKEDEEAESEGLEEPSEKRTLFEKYFPPEKPMIQQHVLTEEMEPDLKRRRMGKITSFQQKKETEGEVESPAKKMLKENLEKLAIKAKGVQELMPKSFIMPKEKGSEDERPDYEITTQVLVDRTPSPNGLEGRVKTVSEGDDSHTKASSTEGGDTLSTEKSTVFYAKVGNSEIEVKEDHHGRIQMGDRKEPIYSRPFKLLKRSLNELSKSTPTLPNGSEEPIEYIDVTELSLDAKEEAASHHYEQLGEPGKKKKLVSKLKVRGTPGGPKLIMVETELVKGKSMSSLNEPATISVVKTVEKQKPPVPPRPRAIAPTIIGKSPSAPTTPTSSITDSCQGPLFPECIPEEGVSSSSTRAPTPTSMRGSNKIAPPRPPPPKISSVTTKVTPTKIKTTTVSSESKPQTTTFRKPVRPARPPQPEATMTKRVQKRLFGAEKYSVQCQTEVGLSTDPSTDIQRWASSSHFESPSKPPTSRSTSKSAEKVAVGNSYPCGPKPYDAVFYDETVRLKNLPHSQETELSKRISTLQILEEKEAPAPPPRARKAETDVESSDSIYYDCLGPEDFRSVTWAEEDEVRLYEKVTDESRSNSISRSTPPPSASPGGTNSLDELNLRIGNTDHQLPEQVARPRKRRVKRSPARSAHKTPDGFALHEESDEDTDELMRRAQEIQDQLRQLMSYRTEPLRVCLEADMSSSTDTDAEQVSRSAIQSHSAGEEGPMEQVSSDSEEEKELTPPPQDPREKALKHASNVAREMASSEAAFVDALKLIVEDFKGAINAGREERGDILIPNEVLDPILLYLPELLKFSSDLLANLHDRVANYEKDMVIADVFVKIGQFLKLYAHYIKDYKARCTYLEDARKKYPEFNQIVQQFEASPRCNKLSVVQYMLKPVQRIPQYRLLLADYFKHLPEDHPDRANAQQGLHIVSAVADHADETMKQGENHAEMVRLQNSLMSTKLNVFKPGRMLIKKGNLLKHNRKTPQLKHVVLFSDCLAYMTQVQSSLNTLKLNRELSLVGITVKHDEAFPNEFSVLSPSKSFTLIAQNEVERQEWVDAIREAVRVFEQKRRTFPAKSTENSEDSELNHAPVWTPDSRVTMCQICKVSFTTFRRRHHCRSCGIVICGVCSKREAWLTYNGGAYGRVCDTCAVKLPRERLKSTAGLPDIMPGTPEVGKEHILFQLGANDDCCTMSGYLKMFKKGSWKRYWYVLREKVLYVYKASADIAPVDQMVVLGFELVEIDDTKKVDHLDLCFKLRHQGLDDMLLCAEDANTATKWKEKIRSATQI